MSLRVFEFYNLKTGKLWDRIPDLEAVALSNKRIQFLLEVLPDKLRQTILNRACGVEIEVERADGIGNNLRDFWQVKIDNSLRNGGVEFVTKFGMRVGHMWRALTNVQQVFVDLRTKHNNPGLFDFSERCSVHVHLDIRTFTNEQIRNLLILYTLFEKPLFRFAGPHRQSNVFTVPLRSSEILNMSVNKVPVELGKMWEKYCAINLGAMAAFGTVEFRHMEGNSDATRIYEWVLMLSLLVSFAEKVKTDDLEKMVEDIKLASQYQLLLNNVFFAFQDLLEWSPREIDDACSDSKQFFHGED